jgi:hypothetical protein
MIVLRSLLVPCYPTSLIFVGLSAALLAVTAFAGYESAILRVIPAFFLLSWLFKYAYSMLDDVANGLHKPPVPSVDMLGPFERRPLVQLLLGAAVYKVTALIGGRLESVILVIYLALLPASIGILGVTEELLAAINPVTLVRTAWAMGWYYLLILCVTAGYALALQRRTALWEFAWYALLEFAVLSVFSLIGGVIFLRREQLGFEPRSSPERQASAAEAERLQRRARVLDQAYGFVRVSEHRQAVAALGEWLGSVDARHVALDARAIMTQAARWNSDRSLAAVSQFVIAYLMQGARLDLALEALDAALAHLPGFALDSESATLLLARRARAQGQTALARSMLENFAARVPAVPLSLAAQALLRDLAP